MDNTTLKQSDDTENFATSRTENPQINNSNKCKTIMLRVEPNEITKEFPRPKTARQLLHALNLAEESALVARDGKLLTPDRHIWPGDNILVRIVASKG